MRHGMALRACAAAAVVIITYKMLARATHLTALDDLAHELVVVGTVWRYGLEIFDEVWTQPAPTYLQSCARVPCRVRVGLTADERRCDGKESVITRFVGPVRHELTLARPRRAGRPLTDAPSWWRRAPTFEPSTRARP